MSNQEIREEVKALLESDEFKEEVESVFTEHDADETGTINTSEMLTFCQELYSKY